MEIRLGVEAVGQNGGLGKVKRFMIDPASQRAEEMTIGGLSERERVVSLLRVVDVKADRITLDMDKKEFESMALFNEDAYRARDVSPDASIVRPPSWPDDPGNSARFKVTGGVGEYPISEPPNPPGQSEGPEVTPLDEREPTVAEGTAVLAADGETVGHVAAFAVDHVTGAPVSLTLHRGLLGLQHVDISLDWLDAFRPEGVALKVSKQEIQERK